MARLALLLLLCAWGCCPRGVEATERAPWFGPMVEFEFRPSVGGSHYRSIDTGDGVVERSSSQRFVNLSLSVSPWPRWAVEAEVLTGETRDQVFGFTHGRGTVRYLLLDDAIGDPVSVTVGGQVTLPGRDSRKDISLLYHGSVELEGHVAIGKEVEEQGRVWRVWGATALGFSNVAAWWGNFSANFSGLFCQHHEVRCSLSGIRNWKGHSLYWEDPFKGYADVRHHSVTAGLGYTYHSDYHGDVLLDYDHRLWAGNCPRGESRITLALCLPFSL